MASESEQQSILQQLEHLIFDEHKLISYKWLTNHFKIHIEISKQILSTFVNKHRSKLLIHHCITGYKQITINHQNPYNSEYKAPSKSKKNIHSDDDDINMQSTHSISDTSTAFTILIISDKDLKDTQKSFDKITNTHIHSIAIKQSENIPDFFGALYTVDYEQQRDVITSAQTKDTFSNITSNTTQTAPIQLNSALSRTKQEEREFQIETKNKNKNHNKASFKDKIETIKKQKPTPLKHKFNNLQIHNGNNGNAKENEIETENLSPNTNTNNKNIKQKQGGIAACFAKAATVNRDKDKDKKTENVDKKPSKSKKCDDITHFFDVDDAKKKKKKKQKKKKKSKKKKKKKSKLVSIQPARKRRRGEIEEDNTLVPIDYDSESSESAYNDMDEYGLTDDEELEQITSHRHNTVKKTRTIVDSDEDEDIDLNTEKEKKMSKKQMEKEKKKETKQKLLNDRKQNFFGSAKANDLRKRKKYKKIQKSYIDDNGMFVTEDVEVTDDEEDGEEQDANVHKHQNMVKCEGGNDDDDVDMNKVKVNGVKKKKDEAKNKKKVSKGKGGKKKNGKKNGNIMNFFKAK